MPYLRGTLKFIFQLIVAKACQLLRMIFPISRLWLRVVKATGILYLLMYSVFSQCSRNNFTCKDVNC